MLPAPRWLFTGALLLGAFTFGCASNGGANSGGQPSSGSVAGEPPPERDAATSRAVRSNAGVHWRRAPIVPTFTRAARGRLVREVARANRAGMRAGVFTKVGDSNSDYPAQLYGLGCRPVNFGPHGYLAPTLRRYRSVDLGNVATFPGCRPANSFSRDSASAETNATTSWALTPVGRIGPGSFALPPEGCPDAVTPIRCEIDLIRPRYVLMMIGSGDAFFGDPLGRPFARNLQTLILRVRRLGPVPVMATLPPFSTFPAENRRILAANRIVRIVTGRMGVPLINVWRAMNHPRMINSGLSDGLHLGVYRGDGSPNLLRNAANLTNRATRHGANRRNLIWLQTLMRLDRTAHSR